MTAHTIYIKPGQVPARHCLLLHDQMEIGSGIDKGAACRKHVHHNDTITWCSPAGTSKINFINGTPLANNVTSITVSKGCTDSYNLDQASNDRYKYIIQLTLPSGASDSEDPQVIIDGDQHMIDISSTLGLGVSLGISLLAVGVLSVWVFRLRRRLKLRT
jgi:hypothetical protein